MENKQIADTICKHIAKALHSNAKAKAFSKSTIVSTLSKINVIMYFSIMNYRESERIKALRIRDEFFKDPGNGAHLKTKYPFVLEHAEKNLWAKIREEAIKYFADNQIVWWPGSAEPGYSGDTDPPFRSY